MLVTLAHHRGLFTPRSRGRSNADRAAAPRGSGGTGMSKSQQFQPVQFALLIHDGTGAKIGGTGSQHDLDGTRRLAESILRTMPLAMTVQIHPWIDDTYAASCTEVVCRSVSEASESAP